MPESLDEKRMSNVFTWKDDIALIAGPYNPSNTRESWLSTAARRAKITYRQCKSLWYGECVDPKYSVAVSVRSAADQARKEALEIASRLETAAVSLDAKDADFYGAQITALVEQARDLRFLVGAGTQGDK